MLKEKGIEPVGERDHAILSATVHASPWGAQFYGPSLPGDPNRIRLTLAPVYDKAADFSVGLVLRGNYSLPIYAFLKSCEASRVPKSEWRSIKERYHVLIKDWQVKIDVDVWFRKAMAVAQQRILKGEKSEAVLEELRKRFEERYGEDDRNAGLHASPNEGEA